mmetsp:Transcript_52615/g.104422  ORF Transcript_52615/g.104422 Transcript_52615/m.104422 type:complete len:525 (+) Transcript_52615:97-1671(+)|eukprot:CAMPEP_0172733690 /NCGR_PEP_ID=MMETSP1074-20121228/107802_1 /TAXON_ID=2916 /ORGANISM="Ceratium fusus, Strain PA161109" /LENGTH=524 /DNA_ID=CAMNT_0013562301 /DNA_START=31 /DNA_END=1605 /DNA_ORIENTATION=+
MESQEAGASLVLPFQKGDAAGFLSAIRALLKSKGFPGTRTELMACASALKTPDFGFFALSCLLDVAGLPGRQKDLQVAALLADLGPTSAHPDNTGKSAADTLGDDPGNRCLLGVSGEAVLQQLVATSEGLSLAIRVLQSWGIHDKCLSCDLRKAVANAVMRETTGAVAVAAVALGALPGLLEADDVCRVIEAVDDGSHDDVAQKLVVKMAREFQVWFVKRRQTLGRFKGVAQAVKILGLQADFPDADFTWRKQALAKSVEHKNRAAAVGLCCDEPRLHNACVAGLLQAQEPELAVELAEAWGIALPPDAVAVVTEARQRARAAYLCLPEGFQVHMVDSEAAVAGMTEALAGVQAVGYDVENMPTDGLRAMLLQLATPTAAYLIDLPALSGSAILADAITNLLSTPSIAKVGFDSGRDLHHVGQVLPNVARCLQRGSVPGLQDVRDLEAARIATERGVGRKQARDGIGLSSLAERHLGKPLNKAMQVCDWSRRPLSTAQRQYAALDAWAPLQLYELLRGGARIVR